MNTSSSTYGTARYVSVSRAAEVLSLSQRSIRRYCAENAIPARRVGAKWLVPVTWLRGSK